MSRQATIVAWYGPKQDSFAVLITACQKSVAKLLPGFIPYSPEQVHATIVGLERAQRTVDENWNFATLRSEHRRMDVAGFIHHLQQTALLPCSVQFGGFEQRDYPFTSRGKRPRERSFSIQGDNVVLMGWPVHLDEDGAIAAYAQTLERLRQDAATFNVLHQYHRTTEAVDNDCYLRLGLCKNAAAPEVEVQLRDFLSVQSPVLVDLTTEYSGVASYEDETLPRSTRWWPLTGLDPTLAFVRQLYDDEGPRGVDATVSQLS